PSASTVPRAGSTESTLLKSRTSSARFAFDARSRKRLDVSLRRRSVAPPRASRTAVTRRSTRAAWSTRVLVGASQRLMRARRYVFVLVNEIARHRIRFPRDIALAEYDLEQMGSLI